MIANVMSGNMNATDGIILENFGILFELLKDGMEPFRRREADVSLAKKRLMKSEEGGIMEAGTRTPRKKRRIPFRRADCPEMQG